MNEWMIGHITHFVTWYSIYEDLPEKLSRAQDQEKLVSAAILELAFSLASCLFKNQFIATSGAQRTPMQKRAFAKSSLYSYPHSPVSAGAPGTGAAHHQSSSGVLRWASHTAFSAVCPLFGLLTGLLLIPPLWNVVPTPDLFLFVISLMSQFPMPVIPSHENPLHYFKGPQLDPPTTRQWELYNLFCFPLLLCCQETLSYVLCPASLFSWGF